MDRFGTVNVNSPIAVDKYLKYVDKIFYDSNYENNLSESLNIRKKIKSAIKSGLKVIDKNLNDDKENTTIKNLGFYLLNLFVNISN